MSFLLIIFLFAQAPKAATGPHQAVLNYQNSSCTTITPCLLQVWRARCTSPTSCPHWGGLNVWTQLTTGAATVNKTDTGTTWIVTDNDPALQDSTTYEYLATNSYQSAATIYSSQSAIWSGTTNAGAAAVPVAPTVGTGNSIQ